MNKKGLEDKTVLLWTACLLMVIVVSFGILPKILVSGAQIGSSQSCATHTVQPVSCSVILGEEGLPWKVNVQMTEPVDPNIEGTLTSLRATVGASYTDLRYDQPGFPYVKGQLIQVQIIGKRNESMPSVPQVVVDSIYTLPSGSTTLCRSLPLTCT